MQATTTADRLKTEFQFTLSKISHEIRNPVALINSGLQMLASAHPEIVSYEGWEDIMENLEYVRELLNDLSDYNNAGRALLQDTSMKEYLQAVLSAVRPTMEYLGIILEADLSGTLPVLPVDRVKIRQALLNLLRNAQEAVSLPGGRISVRAEARTDGVCIAIRDNGCGMTPLQLEDVFTPFVTFKPAGSGLGLAVTRQIVEAHGGEIRAESVPGRGSVFYIFLPQHPPRSPVRLCGDDTPELPS